jgi:hypothetical protein
VALASRSKLFWVATNRTQAPAGTRTPTRIPVFARTSMCRKDGRCSGAAECSIAGEYEYRPGAPGLSTSTKDASSFGIEKSDSHSDRMSPDFRGEVSPVECLASCQGMAPGFKGGRREPAVLAAAEGVGSIRPPRCVARKCGHTPTGPYTVRGQKTCAQQTPKRWCTVRGRETCAQQPAQREEIRG